MSENKKEQLVHAIISGKIKKVKNLDGKPLIFTSFGDFFWHMFKRTSCVNPEELEPEEYIFMFNQEEEQKAENFLKRYGNNKIERNESATKRS